MTSNKAQPAVKDPVCGMDVDPTTTKHRSEYRGETFFFCSLMCKRAFQDDPLHCQSKNKGRVRPAPGPAR